MRSLIAVTSEMPWPLDSGGHLRTYHLLRALSTRLDVRLVSRAAAGHISEGSAALRAAGIEPCVVVSSPRGAAQESAKALAAAFAREPYVLFARHRHDSVRERLAKEIARRRPDALYFDHLDSLVYADVGGPIPIVLDMHNVYSRLAARMACDAGRSIRGRYLAGQARLLHRMERKAVQIAHTVMAVSDEEATYFRALGAKRVTVVPNGVDCAGLGDIRANPRTDPPTILYVGSLAWPPNVSAARFLAREVLPAVRRHVPRTRLVIVGKDPGPDVLALANADGSVAIAANVPDLAPYYRAAHVLAVPLTSGGGTRLKILEAFAARVPVVSTAVGCEGIHAVDGEHLVIAERHAFADVLVGLLRAPVRCRALTDQARTLAESRYDWSAVGRYACDAVAGAAQ